LPVATILWESDWARTFGHSRIATLSDNARTERAEAAVLDSSLLPDDSDVAGLEAWIVSPRRADSIAKLSRSGLREAARVRMAIARA
jgi:hypothetical protein